MAKVKYIKLTLKPRYHADVIAILDGIEPSKVAATVIEALRVWQRGGKTTGIGATAQPELPAVMESAAPITAAVVPVTPPQPTRSKVDLNVGL